MGAHQNCLLVLDSTLDRLQIVAHLGRHRAAVLGLILGDRDVNVETAAPSEDLELVLLVSLRDFVGFGLLGSAGSGW